MLIGQFKHGWRMLKISEDHILPCAKVLPRDPTVAMALQYLIAHHCFIVSKPAMQMRVIRVSNDARDHGPSWQGVAVVAPDIAVPADSNAAPSKPASLQLRALMSEAYQQCEAEGVVVKHISSSDQKRLFGEKCLTTEFWSDLLHRLKVWPMQQNEALLELECGSEIITGLIPRIEDVEGKWLGCQLRNSPAKLCFIKAAAEQCLACIVQDAVWCSDAMRGSRSFKRQLDFLEGTRAHAKQTHMVDHRW